MNCVCKRRHDGEIETMCAWHWRNAVRMLNAGEIEKVRRERDDLIELLSGIGRQASEMAKSYKKE